MRKHRKHEAGGILISFALFLTLLLGFGALATECGRWYLVRAELSKSVDAGALEGAKNISNPFASPLTIAQDFCAENFKNGAYGTSTTGVGVANFTAEMVGANKIKVTGNVSAEAFLGIVGFKQIPVTSSGAAAMRKVEIMLVLDRSWSMSGTPMNDLKKAATTFVDFFAASQGTDRMGLISFSTAVSVDKSMGTNYVASMKEAIADMNVDWATNIEDALDQADGPSGLSNQNGVPSEDRVQQIVVLFTDGYPTAFRDNFRYKNVTYDGCVFSGSDCESGSGNINNQLYNPATGGNLAIPCSPTGNGGATTPFTTYWHSFDLYPIAGYAPNAYNIPSNKLHDYVCQTSSVMAIDQAKALKNNGVTIFVIALGNLNKSFLDKIGTAPDMVYVTPSSNQLQALFLRVAKEIKLRLVS